MRPNASYILLFAVLLLSIEATAQKKTFTHEEGKKYFTLELDDDAPQTWGTYRALNHHDLPYFEMTFISDQKINEVGDTIMIIIPTFYAYSYLSKIQGEADTINTKKQNIRFYFTVKDKGKRLEFVAPDSITRDEMIAVSSFAKKPEADITSFPPELVLVKKPKWRNFPLDLRRNLAKRLKELHKRTPLEEEQKTFW